MKITLAAFAASLLMAGMAAHATAATGPQMGTIARVTIENYAFKSPSITVARGSTVQWKNLDGDPHTVTAVNGSFDSKGLAHGDTFTFRFTKPGKYAYYCKVHPMMRGTVIVKEISS
ncbi:MAG TPA: cupredoxin family copper-binding protein [Candidatus Eremiobacteraceae bacterium]|nr:cupredoxin family copper-binding protein [Candidatus Eremiobacteraceae bacterium]